MIPTVTDTRGGSRGGSLGSDGACGATRGASCRAGSGPMPQQHATRNCSESRPLVVLLHARPNFIVLVACKGAGGRERKRRRKPRQGSGADAWTRNQLGLGL